MPSRLMISAIAVPSFMTVLSPWPCGSVWTDPFIASWNRISPAGKARPVRGPGSADMRFGDRGAGEGEGSLPRVAATIEYGSHQTEEIIPHADTGQRRRFDRALFCVAVDQEADVVLSRLTLLRGHCTRSRGCRSPTMRRRCTSERKFSVPYDYRTERMETSGGL